MFVLVYSSQDNSAEKFEAWRYYIPKGIAPLAKYIFLKLASKTTSSVLDTFERRISGQGAIVKVRAEAVRLEKVWLDSFQIKKTWMILLKPLVSLFHVLLF